MLRCWQRNRLKVVRESARHILVESAPQMETIIDDLRSLVTDVNARIQAIVEYWYQAEEPNDFETKAWRIWNITLGTLACDVGSAAAGEAATGSLRASDILSRSLFEYYARIAYYEAFPKKSVTANREAAEIMRRLTAQQLSYVKHALPSDLRDWIEQQGSAVTPQQLRNMLEDMLRAIGATDEARQNFIDEYYLGFYFVASFVAHGSQGSILDVLDGVAAEADDRIWVSLATVRPDALRVPTLYRIAHILIRILQVMEKRGDIPGLVTENALERLHKLDVALVKARAKYAKGRPPYLARLRTAGA